MFELSNENILAFLLVPIGVHNGSYNSLNGYYGTIRLLLGPLETPTGSSNGPYRSLMTHTGVLMVSNGTIRLLLGPIESSRTIRGIQ